MAQEYTQDWFSHNIPVLTEILVKEFSERKTRLLEIGVFEGRSTVWFLENVLTHRKSKLTWIDSFTPMEEHKDIDMHLVRRMFHANTREFGYKLTGFIGSSKHELRSIYPSKFDIIYIDGSHDPESVLFDAVLSWPLLTIGGLMGFDDYEWPMYKDEPTKHPKTAIDAFLNVMQGKYELIHKDYQVWIKRIDATLLM